MCTQAVLHSVLSTPPSPGILSFLRVLDLLTTVVVDDESRLMTLGLRAQPILVQVKLNQAERHASKAFGAIYTCKQKSILNNKNTHNYIIFTWQGGTTEMAPAKTSAQPWPPRVYQRQPW